MPSIRVLAAGASLKGTMDCVRASEAIQAGAHAAGATSITLPIADGGDGSLLALGGAGFSLHRARCSDALGRPISAEFGWNETTRTAVVEFAQAAGIARLLGEPSDPWRRSSRGVGELMLEALTLGPRELVVLLGGSATQDAGIGLLWALGANLTGPKGPLPSAADLGLLEAVDLSPALRRLKGVRLVVAADVEHVLCGERGSAHSFARQKGFAELDVPLLDAHIRNAGEVLRAASHIDVSAPGSGAAGGAGAALLALGAEPRAGAELILDLLHFDAALAPVDLLVTCEGRVDHTTWAGKAPWAAARRAMGRGIPALIVAGSIGTGGASPDPRVRVVPAASSDGTAGPAEIAGAVRAAIASFSLD